MQNTQEDSISIHPIAVDGERDRPRRQNAGRIRQFALRVSERKLLLACFDLLAINVALYSSLSVRLEPGLANVSLVKYLLWAATLSIMWLMVALLLEVYDLAKASRALYSSWATGSAALLTGIVYQLTPFITPSLSQRRIFIFLFPLLAVTGVMIWRYLYAHIFSQPAFNQRALVVGAGWSGRTLAEAVAESNLDGNGNPTQGSGYRLLGFVDDDVAKSGQEIRGIPVLGTRHELVALVRELQPDELVLAITNSQAIHGELFRAILDCQEMGVSLSTMAGVYERFTGRVPVEHAGKDLSVVLPTVRPAAHRVYLAVRRLSEVLVALIGCLYLLVLMPIVWLANRLGDGGDLFYYQDRVGKGGQVYSLIKFRSMVMGAEEETGAIWASEDDRRITPIGRFLRKTRLDEVPQFWNVLKGEMSLIGPRPERPEFVDLLAEEIPFYRIRHSVRPGITGWAQVNYPYGASVQDGLMKLQYDLYYIKHQGLYLDLKILLKTVQVTLGFKGR